MIKDMKKKIIIVLGMHRSGTSAITRALQTMGVNLGNSLMPSSLGNNDKGFWEDIDFNALNIEILNMLGSDWHHVAPIAFSDQVKLRKQGYFLRAVDLLRSKVFDVPVFGFKDPRVAKLLPFWKEVINHCQYDVCFVMSLRNPLSVVKSLAKRDNFYPEKSYLLWLEHVINSLSVTVGEKRVLVDYDLLMKFPDRELARIARGLNFDIDPAELDKYKSEFLDEKLQHTVYTQNNLDLDASCPSIVREIYTALWEVASDLRGLDDAGLQRQVDEWVKEVERLNPLLALVDKCSSQEINLNQTVTERDEEIFRKDELIAELRQAVAERDEQIAGLCRTVEDREELLTRLFSSRSWKMTAPLRFIGCQARRLRS